MIHLLRYAVVSGNVYAWCGELTDGTCVTPFVAESDCSKCLGIFKAPKPNGSSVLEEFNVKEVIAHRDELLSLVQTRQKQIDELSRLIGELTTKLEQSKDFVKNREGQIYRQGLALNDLVYLLNDYGFEKDEKNELEVQAAGLTARIEKLLIEWKALKKVSIDRKMLRGNIENALSLIDKASE